MYTPLKLLCLLSTWPFFVLGSFQVLVQTPATTFKPGDTITYTLVADPIPSGTLGMVLIQVQEGNAGNPRPFTPFSATMAFSPQQFTVQIPTSLTLHSFYTIDAHADSSVESTLLGNSDPFEIEITSPSSTTPIVTTTENVTKTTVIKTTSQSPSAENTTTAPATTSQPPSSNSNPPSSSTSAPTSNSSISITSQSPSEELSTSTSTSAAESVTSSGSSSSASADASAVSLAQKSRSTPVGAIVGGVVGGILVIILLLAFLLCLGRRRQRHQRDAVFNMPTDTTNSSTVMIQPTPSTPLTAGSPQRPLIPNRSPLAISPFVVINSNQQGESTSPEFSSAKSREAFGAFGAGLGHIPTFPSASLSGDSIMGKGVSQDVLRSEHERVLSEISALRTGTTTGATVANTVTTPTSGTIQPSWSGSSGSAVGSEEDKDNADAAEMRERLEQLTNHVRRLESALVQVSHGYDAPPVYDGSQR